MKYLVFLVSFLFAMEGRSQTAAACGEIPAVNKKILATLAPYNGQKIGRGECWDAAKLALDAAGAEWDGLYVYGRLIDPKKECIQPGDIVQFEGVEVVVKTDKMIMKEAYPHHTAIVSKVSESSKLQLFHQNTGFSGRKMGYSDLDLANITKGKLLIYRPVARQKA
jgi:hypothetical protein